MKPTQATYLLRLPAPLKAALHRRARRGKTSMQRLAVAALTEFLGK
jgi:hypothetical protein